MQRLFAIVVFLTVFFVAFSQKSPVKFGDIPMEDMKMTTYDKDSSAAAVVLVDYGEVETFSYHRHVRIKILRKEGLELANVRLPYLFRAANQNVKKLRASTFNLEDGRIIETEISKDDVFKQKLNEDLKDQKFTMPGVKVGSIIEYMFTLTIVSFYDYPDWEFQKSIPVRWSEYWATIPTAVTFEKYMQGYVPVNVYEVKSPRSGQSANAYHWISKDVPAFKKEPFMTSESDYVSRVNFAISSIVINGITQEIVGSWEKLSETLMKSDYFGEVIKRSAFLKNKVEELTDDITDPIKKVEAIHTYVKQNIEWDKTTDFLSKNLKKAVELRKGSSSDVNLTMGSMLQKAGFDVDMILLSTRDHGFVRKEFPASTQFNYVICMVKLADKFLLLDATEKFLPFDVLPKRCLNGQGLIISSTDHGWVDLISRTKSRTVVSADFKLDPAGEVTGKVTFSRDGYDAYDMRSAYYKKGEETYLKEVLANHNWRVDKTEFLDLTELSKPVQEVYEVTIGEHASIGGDLIYIDPFVEAKENENPFKLEKREYPVDFESLIEKIYLCKIALPEGFVVDELPQSKIFALPENSARFSYNAAQVGNSLNVTSTLQINKSLFLPAEYAHLREFYNLVVAKQAEQIVLKKIQP